ncbi:UTRA domain-containing protein, partial [Enterococcus cecorum]|uniref:UTRA domain-containing protein n=1 Tax=Enterococcus cecorum TaxID=44008 RepID=UPI001FADE601
FFHLPASPYFLPLSVFGGFSCVYISNSLSLKIGSALRKIKADRSDQYDHDFLDCQEADPVLEVEQVVSLKDGRPFEFSQLRYRYDKGQLISNHVIE